MKWTRVVPVAVVTTLSVLGAAAAPGVAVDTDTSVESHCVVDVLDQEPDGELIVSEPRCHGDFSAVMLDASNGSVHLPAATPGTVMFSDATVQAEVAQFALGIHFDGTSGTGSSITVSGSSCTGGHWNTPTSWDNRISSSYNGCGRLRHYDLPGKAGESLDTYGAGTTKNLGVMNNRTESVSYHAS